MIGVVVGVVQVWLGAWFAVFWGDLVCGSGRVMGRLRMVDRGLWVWGRVFGCQRVVRSGGRFGRGELSSTPRAAGLFLGLRRVVAGVLAGALWVKDSR